MSLTQKQELFCAAYIATGNASEAYRRSYNAGNMKPTTVNRKAKALMDNGKIAARIEKLRAPVMEKAQLTLESHLERLEELSLQAQAAGQFGPAVKAEESRGRARGFYVDKKEFRISPLENASDEELDQHIKALHEQIESVTQLPTMH